MSDDENALDRFFNSLDPFGTGSICNYNRDGEPITLMQKMLLEEDDDYARISSDYLDGGNIWVSTVWLGLDLDLGRTGTLAIFETMVFVRATQEQLKQRHKLWREHGYSAPEFPWQDQQMARYATEDEARGGHRRIVDSLRLRVDLLIDALTE